MPRWPRDPTNAYLAKWGLVFAVPVVLILVGWLFVFLTGWSGIHPD
jgi:hypothetical protein